MDQYPSVAQEFGAAGLHIQDCSVHNEMQLIAVQSIQFKLDYLYYNYNTNVFLNKWF